MRKLIAILGFLAIMTFLAAKETTKNSLSLARADFPKYRKSCVSSSYEVKPDNYKTFAYCVWASAIFKKNEDVNEIRFDFTGSDILTIYRSYSGKPGRFKRSELPEISEIQDETKKFSSLFKFEDDLSRVSFETLVTLTYADFYENRAQ